MNLTEKLGYIWGRTVLALLTGASPPQCLLCDSKHTLLNSPLCSYCHEQLPWNLDNCISCALPLAPTTLILAPNAQANPQTYICAYCQKRPFSFEQTRCLWRYEHPVDWLISRMKYQQDLSATKLLCSLFAQHFTAQLPSQNRPDVITAVPQHWRRQLSRGIHQADLLGREISRQSGISFLRLSKKKRHTATQQGLTRRQREHNLQGAFSVTATVKGLRIALVDDVMTTGATAEELSRCFLASGALAIDVYCLARTPSHTD